MSRRSILSAAERSSLLVVPDCVSEFERWYSITEADLSFVGLRRGDANRLGVAVQLCLLRFPGQAFSAEVGIPDALVGCVARQLKVDVCCWVDYAERDETRCENVMELQAFLGLEAFNADHFRETVEAGALVGMNTEKGVELAVTAIEFLRTRNVVVPRVEVVERLCAEEVVKNFV